PTDDPVSADAALRHLVLGPVQRERAVALDVEVAGLAWLDGFAVGVEDLQLVSRHRLAAGPGSNVIDPVRAVDVQHLGRSDAIDDGEPVSLVPSPPDLSRQ